MIRTLQGPSPQQPRVGGPVSKVPPATAEFIIKLVAGARQAAEELRAKHAALETARKFAFGKSKLKADAAAKHHVPGAMILFDKAVEAANASVITAHQAYDAAVVKHTVAYGALTISQRICEDLCAESARRVALSQAQRKI